MFAFPEKLKMTSNQSQTHSQVKTDSQYVLIPFREIKREINTESDSYPID